MIPPCDRLHLFFDAELSPEEAEEIRVHLADCSRCQRELHDLMQLDDATGRWAPPPPGLPVAFPPWRRRLRYVSGALAMPVGAAAAIFVLLAVVGYQNLFAVPRLRDQLAEAQAPQPASWHFLTVSRGEAPVIVASRKHRMMGLTLATPAGPILPSYRCQLRDATGRVVWSFAVPGPARGDEIVIVVPAFQLQPGNYVLALAGPESAADGSQSDLAHYPFTVQSGKD